MLSYTVVRAFGHEGTYYTRDNADEIKGLPRELRNHLIQTGAIVEHDDRRAEPDAEPAPPAATSKARK